MSARMFDRIEGQRLTYHADYPLLRKIMFLTACARSADEKREEALKHRSGRAKGETVTKTAKLSPEKRRSTPKQ
jgi:hypothetical protein